MKPSQLLRRWRACALALICACSFLVAIPENGGLASGAPSKDQCTCRISTGKVGAEVINAATCTRDHIRDWCDIYVAALKSSKAQKVIIARLRNGVETDDEKELSEFLIDLFDEHLEAQKRSSQSAYERSLQYRDVLKERISQFTPSIKTCVLAFFDDKSPSIRREVFFCRVDTKSRWLSITFVLGGGRFSYLIGPER